MNKSSKLVKVVEIRGETQQLQKSINEFKNSLNGMNLPPEISKTFDKLGRSIDSVLKKTQKDFIPREEFTETEQELKKIKSAFESLGISYDKLKASSDKKLTSLLPEDTVNKIAKINKAYSDYTKSLDKIVKAEKAHQQMLERKEVAAQEAAAAQEELNTAATKKNTAEQEAKKHAKVTQALEEQKNAAKALIEAKDRLNEARKDPSQGERAVKNREEAVSNARWRVSEANIAASKYSVDEKNAAKAATEKLTQATLAYNQAEDRSKDLNEKASKAADNETKAKQTLNTAQKNAQQSTSQETVALRQLYSALAEINPEYKEQAQNAQYTGVNLEQLRAIIDNLSADELQKLRTALDNSGEEFTNVSQQIDITKDRFQEVKEEIVATDKAAAQQSAFESRIKQFVGAAGAAEVMRRAFRDAFSAIKELDATMTEMAVVTDLSVGDYWDQLPQYSARANELGVAINDVYKSATLYYQQGLKAEEVTAISTETLKMMKIAGLDAEDATNKLTAALRGFNMELNETSAQRVSDVYSELAAITASDVKEISSAMTKTASIASSAGMEFETTAAFLSQIIETTRESAETAGTAMKTVIARFQELKKDPAEIGEVEGEIVDANKIETALRTVGVSLRDASGQFRELDDVFLELAGKWDSLDKNTQRYIATIAAGSRQQSRFIAMMSNYERTMELVDSANNSAGASQKQYEKTLDSMESKLAQLKNAWNEFTMSIMNSELLKKGVDILTMLFNTLNKITAGFDGFGESFSKIGVLITILKTGEILINKMFSSINVKAMETGKIIGQGITEGIREGLNNGQVEINKKKAENTEAGPVQQGFISRVSGYGNIAQGYANINAKLPDSFGDIQNQKLSLQQQKDPFLEAKSVLSGVTGTKTPAALLFQDKDLNQGLFPPKMWNVTEQQFKEKMKKMGADTNQIAKAWNQVSKKIGSDKKASDAFGAMNKELEKQGDIAKKSGQKVTDSMTEMRMSAQNAQYGIKDIDENLNNIDTEIENINQEEENMKNSLIDQKAQGYEQLAKGVGQAGMAITGLGVAFGMLGTAAESAGLDGTAKTLNFLGKTATFAGTALMGISSIMSIATPLVKKFTAAKVQEGAAWWATLIPIGATKIAMWELTLIVIAILAAIALLVVAFVAIKNASPEAKLKKAETAAAEAGEAADKAADEYKELKSSLDSLDDKYKNIENLTMYTNEWKEAVKGVNDEVLDLMTKYPELAKYVKSVNGVLSLDTNSKEVQNVLKKAEEKTYTTNIGKLATQQKVIDAKGNVEYKQLSNKAKTGVQGYGLQKYGALAFALSTYGVGTKKAIDIWENANERKEQDKNNTNELAKAIVSGGLKQDENDNWMIDEAILEGLDLELTNDQLLNFAKKLGDGADELREYGTTLNELDAQNQAYADSMALNAAQMVDTSNFTNEAMETLNVLANGDTFEYLKDQAKWNEDHDLDRKEKEALEQFAKEQLGLDVKNMRENKLIYYENGETMKMSRESIEAQYEAYLATKKMTNALQNLPDAMEEMASEFDKTFKGSAKALEKAFLAQGGKKLTKNDTKELEKILADEVEMKAAFGKLSPEQQDAFGGLEGFKKYLQESVDAANAVYENSKIISDRLLGSETNGIADEKLTTEARKGYDAQLEALGARMSDSGVQYINNVLSGYISKMDKEQTDEFMSQFSSLDLTNIADWEKIPNIFKDIDMALPNTQMKEFVEKSIELSGAIDKINIEKLKESFNELQMISNKIRTGEQGRLMSSSDYAKIIANDPSLAKDFSIDINTGDYVYLGNSIDQLRFAIDKNTEAQLKEYQNRLQNKINVAETLDDFSITGSKTIDYTLGSVKRSREKNVAVDINSISGESEAMQLKYLQNLFTQWNNNGIDIKGLFTHLNSAEGVKNLTSDQLKTTISELADMFNSEGIYREELKNSELNQIVLGLQQNDIFTNFQKQQELLSKQSSGSVLNEQEMLNLEAYEQVLKTQSVLAGINQKDYADYTGKIEELDTLVVGSDEYKNKLAEIIELSKKFASTVNYKQMIANIGQTVKGTKELVEQYNLLSEDDIRGKDTILSDLASKYGLSTTGLNTEDKDALYDAIVEITEGRYSGVQEIFKFIQEQQGLSIETINKFLSNGGTLEDDGAENSFIQMLKNLGLIEETLVEGKTQFELISESAFQTGIAIEGIVEETKKWENPYDWMYNQNEKINAVIRQREKYERQYQHMLESSKNTVSDLVMLRNQSLASLQEESKLLTEQIIKAKEEIDNVFAENEYQQFAEFVKINKTTGQIAVDEFGIDNLISGDEKLQERFEEFMNKVEKYRGIIQDSEDKLEDIADNTKDLLLQGRQEVVDIVNYIKDEIVAREEKEIEALEEMNESINEAQQDLLDKIQEQIDDERQARENDKTEQNIADKQTRLQYLMMDSSGANDLEIAQLRKEIGEEQQSYQDSLIDQALADLQEANDKAAEQRDKQIEIAQEQLESYQDSRTIWNLSESILKSSVEEMINKGIEFVETAAGKMMLKQLGYDNASSYQQQDYRDQVNEAGKEAAAYLANENMVEIKRVTQGIDNSEVTNDINNMNSALTGAEAATENTANSAEETAEDTKIIKEEKVPTIIEQLTTMKNHLEELEKYSVEMRKLFGEDFLMYLEQDLKKQLRIFEDFDKNTFAEVHNINYLTAVITNLLNSIVDQKNGMKVSASSMQSGIVIPLEEYFNQKNPVLNRLSDIYSAIKSIKFEVSGDKLTQYESGGLNTVTGPAWLDGTPTKPEYVLNAEQTSRFFELIDVLGAGSALSTTQTTGSGDNYFDIQINVDNIEDDYDVDQLANRIKSLIYNDAMYRNVNAINSSR